MECFKAFSVIRRTSKTLNREKHITMFVPLDFRKQIGSCYDVSPNLLGIYCAAQLVLDWVIILLSQPSECGDCRSTPPYLYQDIKQFTIIWRKRWVFASMCAWICTLHTTAQHKCMADKESRQQMGKQGYNVWGVHAKASCSLNFDS